MADGATGAWMGRVARLGCIACIVMGIHGTPAQLHHIRQGQGGAQRAPDELVIPLCEWHHTGDGGIHKARRSFELVFGTELDLLALTMRMALRRMVAEGVAL